jgi:hypothetical protein
MARVRGTKAVDRIIAVDMTANGIMLSRRKVRRVNKQQSGT